MGKKLAVQIVWLLLFFPVLEPLAKHHHVLQMYVETPFLEKAKNVIMVIEMVVINARYFQAIFVLTF